MKKNEDLIRQIKRRAHQDARNRQDGRFLEAMAFLVAKGFLRFNKPLRPMPNLRLKIADVIWAGRHVEPRILEVLPAAVLRLRQHFDLDPVRHGELDTVIEQLKRGEAVGNDFYGVPYAKLKQWVDFPLLDKRVKPLNEKKVPKNFRFRPEAAAALRARARKLGCTETELLENLVMA
ncbi:MAG TPA: hypothetical protein VL588_10175 [Bdellovibrionota bacterium]|nr:hypothetical protein [Bdellovibrionota bacterium]